MSEAGTPRRSSHRASGPVDGGNYVRRDTDPTLSPRRRARMQAEREARREMTLNIVAPQPPSETPQTSEGAKDLLTSWLKANGFEDLESFQKMTQEAETRRLQAQAPETDSRPVPPIRNSVMSPGQGHAINPSLLAPGPVPAAGTPATSAPTAQAFRPSSGSNQPAPPAAQTPPQVTLPQYPPPHTGTPAPHEPSGAPASFPGPTREETSTSTAPTKAAATSPGGEPSPADATPPQAALPTVKLKRIEVEEHPRQEVPKPKPHSPRRAAKLRRAEAGPKTPKPLAKTRKVPVVLTLGIVAVLAIAVVLLIVWYRGTVKPDDPAEAKIEVLGAIGAQPVLTISDPIPLQDSSTEVLVKGTGKVIEANDMVAIRLTVFSGLNGKLLSNGGDESVLVGDLSPKIFGNVLYDAVLGSKEGSRLLLKQPVEQEGASTMEIGVIDLIPTSLSGEMTPPPPESGLSVSEDQGLVKPAVLQDFSGEFQAYPLITGGGARVSAGQTVLVKYQEFSYSNPPAVLKDHWHEPVKLSLDSNVQQGVARGLLDQKIGSRMLLEVPPAEGSGNQATILVVDILAAWDLPEAPKES